MKVKPNFLVAGVAKSGTTSLFYYLKQHPEIFLPKKETFFYISEIYKESNYSDPARRKSEDIVYNIDDYLDLFEISSDKKAIGEVGTGYAYYHEVAIPNIKQYVGDIKILLILRNPIQRAFSAYSHFSRDLYEKLPFDSALREESNRIADGWDFMWHYSAVGFYFNQVKAFTDNFSSVQVYLYDDYRRDPINFIKEIYRFLEVDDNFIPSLENEYNVSGELRSKFIQSIIVEQNFIKEKIKPILYRLVKREHIIEFKQYLKSKNISRKSSIDDKSKEYLLNLYKSEIVMLQDLINRDLSSWLK